MFKDIGLFDEDFFAYYEDVDLSFRASWPAGKSDIAQRQLPIIKSGPPAVKLAVSQLIKQ